MGHLVIASVSARGTHVVTRSASTLPGEMIRNILISFVLRLGLSDTLECWYRRRPMGDEVDDLRARVLEQGLALEGL